MRPSSCPRRSRSAARSRPASARGLCLTLSPDAPHTPSEGASFFGIGRNRPGTGETARRLALQRQVRKRYGPPASRLGGGRIIVGKVRFRDPVEEKAPPQGRRRRVLFSDGAVQASLSAGDSPISVRALGGIAPPLTVGVEYHRYGLTEFTGSKHAPTLFVEVPPVGMGIPMRPQQLGQRPVYEWRPLQNLGPPWHPCLEQFLGIRFQPHEQIQQVMSAIRRVLPLSTLPGLQCDLCRQRQEDRSGQSRSLEKQGVRRRRLGSVPFQFLHHPLQRLGVPIHRIRIPAVTTKILFRHHNLASFVDPTVNARSATIPTATEG